MNLLLKVIPLILLPGATVFVSAQTIHNIDLETSIMFAKEQSNKLKVSVSRQPVFIQAVRFSPKTVEYIIEK